jgi:ribosomal protein S18 acetylase RimI-like enzyme
MASTDPEAGPARIRALGAGDLAGAQRLSQSAQWNQNENDWSMMLRLGQGWGIDAADATGAVRLAASIVVLPYGTRFAWVSMVLVLPEQRRRGHAQLLLRQALAHLAAQGRAALLDATPAGHAVYVQAGFADTWGFARYRREARAPLPQRPPAPYSRALTDTDWPAIDALDRVAFGSSRLPLLRSLAQRLPKAARVLEQGGRLRGYVLGRDGREALQIGPLCADKADAARALLHDALQPFCGEALYIDLLDTQHALLPWLQHQGFTFQRPFMRMVHGSDAAPGDPTTIVLAAGPELG